jgi:hypothetical protein
VLPPQVERGPSASSTDPEVAFRAIHGSYLCSSYLYLSYLYLYSLYSVLWKNKLVSLRSSVVQLCYSGLKVHAPESQASQSHPRVFDSSPTLLHPAGPAGSAGTAGSCSLTANSKATESEKWRNARVVRPLHWLRYGFVIARNWILLATTPAPTVLYLHLACSRTVPVLYVPAMPRNTVVRQQRPHQFISTPSIPGFLSSRHVFNGDQ